MIDYDEMHKTLVSVMRHWHQQDKQALTSYKNKIGRQNRHLDKPKRFKPKHRRKKKQRHKLEYATSKPRRVTRSTKCVQSQFQELSQRGRISQQHHMMLPPPPPSLLPSLPTTPSSQKKKKKAKKKWKKKLDKPEESKHEQQEHEEEEKHFEFRGQHITPGNEPKKHPDTTTTKEMIINNAVRTEKSNSNQDSNDSKITGIVTESERMIVDSEISNTKPKSRSSSSSSSMSSNSSISTTPKKIEINKSLINAETDMNVDSDLMTTNQANAKIVPDSSVNDSTQQSKVIEDIPVSSAPPADMNMIDDTNDNQNSSLPPESQNQNSSLPPVSEKKDSEEAMVVDSGADTVPQTNIDEAENKQDNPVLSALPIEKQMVDIDNGTDTIKTNQNQNSFPESENDTVEKNDLDEAMNVDSGSSISNPINEATQQQNSNLSANVTINDDENENIEIEYDQEQHEQQQQHHQQQQEQQQQQQQQEQQQQLTENLKKPKKKKDKMEIDEDDDDEAITEIITQVPSFPSAQNISQETPPSLPDPPVQDMFKTKSEFDSAFAEWNILKQNQIQWFEQNGYEYFPPNANIKETLKRWIQNTTTCLKDLKHDGVWKNMTQYPGISRNFHFLTERPADDDEWLEDPLELHHEALADTKADASPQADHYPDFVPYANLHPAWLYCNIQVSIWISHNYEHILNLYLSASPHGNFL